MRIKITYKDLGDGSILKEITLEDEDVKALKTDMAEIEEWHANAIEEKLRRVTIALVKKILEHPATYLTPKDLAVIKGMLDADKIVFPKAKTLPDKIKKEIIKLATIPITT